MREEVIVTGVVMSNLKCFNLDTLNKRILLQKKMYLLQELGVNLGFQYNWYVHGPYSPDLTSVAYECHSLGERTFKEFGLKKNITEIINYVNDLLYRKEDSQMDETSWYELLASYAYLRKDSSMELAKKRLITAKPKFTMSDTDVAEKVLGEILKR